MQKMMQKRVPHGIEIHSYRCVRPGGRPSNRTILTKVRLTGQFFFEPGQFFLAKVRLTGQLDFQNCPPGRTQLYNVVTTLM